jgi:hypothetical protein
VGVDPEQLGAPAGPPLGELLLSRGLITSEQLEEALADQRESKQPLGEIFVRLGFANGPVIGQALATQHGRMLKSEYGFAMGFDAVLARGDDDADPPPVTVRNGHKPAVAPLEAGALAEAAGLRRVDVPQAPPAPVRPPAPAVAPTGVAAQKPEPVPVAADVGPESGLDEEKAQMAAQIGTLESHLAAAQAVIETARQAHESEATELRQNLLDSQAATDQAIRERDDAGAQLHAAQAAQELQVANEPGEEKAQMAAQIGTLESHLAAAQAVIETARQAHESEATELRQNLLDSQAAIDQAIRERDDAGAQLHAAQAAQEALRRQVATERYERSQLQVNPAQLERLADAEARSRSLAEELAAARAERDAALVRPSDPAKGSPRTVFFLAIERTGPAPAADDPVGIPGEAGLADARDEGDALLADSVQMHSSRTSPEPAEETRHLVFFLANGGGYMLLERAGPAPAVGDVLDVSAAGGTAIASVTKVAQSPIPGPKLRCAYLL